MIKNWESLFVYSFIFNIIYIAERDALIWSPKYILSVCWFFYPICYSLLFVIFIELFTWKATLQQRGRTTHTHVHAASFPTTHTETHNLSYSSLLSVTTTIRAVLEWRQDSGIPLRPLIRFAGAHVFGFLPLIFLGRLTRSWPKRNSWNSNSW